MYADDAKLCFSYNNIESDNIESYNNIEIPGMLSVQPLSKHS